MRSKTLFIICGICAGAVTGSLGAGGGLILVPLLSTFSLCSEEDLFPTSLSIMIPICFVSLLFSAFWINTPWSEAVPYLIGSTLGGILTKKYRSKIPVKWLHRIFGFLILWGGLRFLL